MPKYTANGQSTARVPPTATACGVAIASILTRSVPWPQWSICCRRWDAYHVSPTGRERLMLFR